MAEKSKRIKLVSVDSSMLRAVGYDPATKQLEAVFNSGGVYCYSQVEPETYAGLLAAESKGSYMKDLIIDMHPYRKGPCR